MADHHISFRQIFFFRFVLFCTAITIIEYIARYTLLSLALLCWGVALDQNFTTLFNGFWVSITTIPFTLTTLYTVVTRHTERAEQDKFYDTLVKKGKKIYYYLRPHKYVVAKLLTHSRLLLIYLYVCLFIYLFIYMFIYFLYWVIYLLIPWYISGAIHCTNQIQRFGQSITSHLYLKHTWFYRWKESFLKYLHCLNLQWRIHAAGAPGKTRLEPS